MCSLQRGTRAILTDLQQASASSLHGAGGTSPAEHCRDLAAGTHAASTLTCRKSLHTCCATIRREDAEVASGTHPSVLALQICVLGAWKHGPAVEFWTLRNWRPRTAI